MLAEPIIEWGATPFLGLTQVLAVGVTHLCHWAWLSEPHKPGTLRFIRHPGQLQGVLDLCLANI